METEIERPRRLNGLGTGRPFALRKATGVGLLVGVGLLLGWFLRADVARDRLTLRH